MRAARRQRSNTGDAGDRAKAAFPSARRSPGKAKRSQTVSSTALPRKGRKNTSARRTGSRRADASARGSPFSARCETPPVAAWRAWAFAAGRQASSLLADRMNARQDRRAPRMRTPARRYCNHGDFFQASAPYVTNLVHARENPTLPKTQTVMHGEKLIHILPNSSDSSRIGSPIAYVR